MLSSPVELGFHWVNVPLDKTVNDIDLSDNIASVLQKQLKISKLYNSM